MLRIVSFLILIISLSADGLAQSSNNLILLKGGTAGYGNIQGLQVDGNGGPGRWKIGPILGVGIERELNKSWSLQATFEYSNNIYDGSKTWEDSLTIGKNTVVDLMGNIKKKWNWFYLLAGVGFSIQKSSDTYAVAFGNSIYEGGRYYKLIFNEGTSSNGLTGLLGIGIQFHLVKNIEFFFEGSIRGRRYGSAAAQLGIIHEI
ncbi:MAG: hypothetical protein M0Q21_11490 [Ignavibacteriaceae bacterium]|nr:hypothetical protein [Ignavibacteriaceae bacterium]